MVFHDHVMNLAEVVDFLAVGIHREQTLPASHRMNPYDWIDGLHCGTNVGWSSTRSFKALSHGTSLFAHWLCLEYIAARLCEKDWKGLEDRSSTS